MRIITFFFCLLFVYGCSNDMSQTDKIRGQILGQYAKQMKSKGLYGVGGGGGEKNGKINLIEITFDVDHILNIETAREYMVDSTLNLMDLINKNEQYRNYFEMFPVKIDIIHISIIGQDINNKANNYVRIVSVANGIISYDIRSETPQFPPLITIHEETFEEAQRILAQRKLENRL